MYAPAICQETILTSVTSVVLPKTVRQLAWRPSEDDQEKDGAELAIAGDDSSLRICGIVFKVTQ